MALLSRSTFRPGRAHGDGERLWPLLQVDQAHFVEDVQADADAALEQAAPVGAGSCGTGTRDRPAARPVLWEMRQVAPDGGKIRPRGSRLSASSL